MTRVLVTGGSGFIGRFVMGRLAELGAEVIGGARSRPPASSTVPAWMTLDSNDSLETLTNKLVNVDAVVHLAAAVHDMKNATPEASVFAINRDWTERLARASLRAGVSRFVFASSVKVNGEGTTKDEPYTEDSSPKPEGAYARSKREAEQALEGIARSSSLEISVVRPVLVYGPGVRANFRNLLSIVNRGVPLPFGAVNNSRSLVYVENFADLCARLALREKAPAFSTYLVSDGEDVSTSELIRRLASSLKRPARLLNVPESWLFGCAKAAGKQGVAQRLLGSLRVDSSRVRRELGWTPPFTLDMGLERTAAWFLSSGSRG